MGPLPASGLLVVTVESLFRRRPFRVKLVIERRRMWEQLLREILDCLRYRVRVTCDLAEKVLVPFLLAPKLP
jgi:hypothetical protein